MRYVVDREELPHSGISHTFEGSQHGDLNVSFYWVDAPPGSGPPLHVHDYEEVFVILEGRATYTVGETEIRAGAGQVVIVPPTTPHKFLNTGDGPLRQIDIHGSGTMMQTNLE